jgi:hypothetical protein
VLCIRYELKQHPKNNTTKERLFVCVNLILNNIPNWLIIIRKKEVWFSRRHIHYLRNMSLVCSTYFDKDRLLTEKCLICLNEEMSSFLPILPNEAFTFNYNDKRGE